MSGLVALVLGGTGEVGRELVRELVANPAFSRVVMVGRREVQLDSDKAEQKVVDFDNLDLYKEAFQGAQVSFCCLGTTRGKAGTKGFVKVDRDYVVHAARLLKEAGCPHFNLVSYSGANKNAFFLYPKTKGEAESMVTEINFPRLSIFRPALLLCEREETRPVEKIAQVVVRGFDWRNKISIGTDTVARAMVINALEPQSPTKSEECKVEIFQNTDILRLGID